MVHYWLVPPWDISSGKNATLFIVDVVLCTAALASLLTVLSFFSWSVFRARRYTPSKAIHDQATPPTKSATGPRSLNKLVHVAVSDVTIMADVGRDSTYASFTLQLRWVDKTIVLKKRYSEFVVLAATIQRDLSATRRKHAVEVRLGNNIIFCDLPFAGNPDRLSCEGCVRR
ncbi:hypothetical protein AC1031_003667 [Aphanomyces cochlioides]|nr:hypothetical protein AC1031_003667 [Aphanomyces cochlioides]